MEREPGEPSEEQRDPSHTRESGVESLLCPRPGRRASEPAGRTVPEQPGADGAKTAGSAMRTAPRALRDPGDETQPTAGEAGD